MKKPLVAIVVFHDNDEHPLSWMLKKGFKHCFVCVNTGRYWVRVNLTSPIPEIKVEADFDYNLVDFYREMGYTVIYTRQRLTRMKWYNPFFGTLMVANCVGLVKTILSINTLSWTPYSLFKELTK